MGGHRLLKDLETINRVWELRKAGLGLLLSKRTYSRAIAFIEDIAVPPDELAPFMEKFLAYLASKGKQAGIYGHVGAGCLHIRPYFDLRSQEELQLMHQMMVDVCNLLIEHGGVLSGEHGDGLVRSWMNERLFGPKLYRAFIDLKRAFDPHNRLNPGKIVHGPPLEQNLRLSPSTPLSKLSTFLDFSPEGGYELAVDLCNGNGLCRKREKVMCPSFQATGDEYDSTRARAQALRGLIHGQLHEHNLDGIRAILDLSLNAKGAKRNVLASRHGQDDKRSFSISTRKTRLQLARQALRPSARSLSPGRPLDSPLQSPQPDQPLAVAPQNKIGITRPLPLLAPQRFSAWYRLPPSRLSQKAGRALQRHLYRISRTPHRHRCRAGPRISRLQRRVLPSSAAGAP